MFDGHALDQCCAVVILPVRNEENTLRATLDSLAAQCDLDGAPLPATSFEILLLLNNCTDGSAAVAAQWVRAHPSVRLQVEAITLPPEQAHVGTARRLLMDTACARLDGTGGVLLSTDADTLLAEDWLAQTLAAIARGADVVTGAILLSAAELDALPAGARQGYLYDRCYQRLVAELEDLIDPQAGDPWPRHLEHFGASLACTTQIYTRVGGLPALPCLEDVAFIDRLRRIDARIRHEPAVRVYTSARLEGRTQVGLSSQLREWQRLHECGLSQHVLSAEWLTHRFSTLHRLRVIARCDDMPNDLGSLEPWRDCIRQARGLDAKVGEYLARIDCDAIIAASFDGVHETEIEATLGHLLCALALRKGSRAAVGTVEELLVDALDAVSA